MRPKPRIKIINHRGGRTKDVVTYESMGEFEKLVAEAERKIRPIWSQLIAKAEKLAENNTDFEKYMKVARSTISANLY